MESFEQRGWGIRELAKGLFLDYMRSRPECQPGQEGIRLARIFRGLGRENRREWSLASQLREKNLRLPTSSRMH